MKLDKSTSSCPGIPVKLEVGLKSYCTDVYVSPIDDDMLLVLDFLKRHHTITDLKNNTFTIGDDQITLYCGSQSEKQLGCEAWKPCQFSGW
jgi:hypothetical protein